MSLNIGTLVGYVSIDTDQMKQGLADGKEKLKGFAEGAGKLLAVGGAAGGALLVGGLIKAMDLQGANAKLAGQLGLSADTAARYGKIAGKVYSDNWGESIDDVNDAIKSITQNIGEGSDQWLKDTTETVLAMSSTFGVGADEISRSVAQMLNTGVVKDSSEALDVLTVGFQNGDDRAGDLLDTMTEYSTQFRKLGVDGPQAIGLISQGLQGGARDADLVADSLKEFSIRAVDGSTTTAAGFKALGLDAQAMAERIGKGGDSASSALDETLDKLRAIPDPVKRSQAAVELFGTQAEDLGTALYDLDPSNAVQAIGDVAGAADKMAKTVGDTASGNIESFKRQLTTTFVTFVGGKLIPIVTTVTGWFSSHLGPAISGVTEFLRDHREMVKTVAIVLGAIATAIGVVVLVTKAWGLAQAALNLVLDANPIGLIVIALAGIVTAIVIAYKKVQWFHDLLDGVWAAIKVGWSVVAKVFSAVWHGVVEPVWHAFAATVTWLYQNVLQPAFAWISAKWDELSGKLQTLWQTRIQPALAAFGAAAQDLWQNYLQKLADWWDQHWPAIAAVLQQAWQGIIQPALQALGSMINWLWNTILVGIVDYVQAHWPAISAIMQTAASEVGTAFHILGTVISTVWGVVSGIWNAMKSAWATASGLISGGAHAVSSAFSAISTTVSGVYTAVKTAFDNVVTFVTGIPGKVVAAIGNVGSTLYAAGKSIIDGFFNGLKNAWDKVTGFISGIAGWISDHKGPLSYDATLLTKHGQAVMGGFNKGLLAGWADTQDLIAGMGPELAASGPSLGGVRGGDGAAALGGPRKVVTQNIEIKAGWSARETERFLTMQAGTG